MGLHILNIQTILALSTICIWCSLNNCLQAGTCKIYAGTYAPPLLLISSQGEKMAWLTFYGSLALKLQDNCIGISGVLIINRIFSNLFYFPRDECG